MSKFIIKDEKRYPIKPHMSNDAYLPYWRFEHRVTLGYQGRVFMVFVDNGIPTTYVSSVPPKLYIEEITDGNLKLIEEDELHEELADFVVEHGFSTILVPIPKDRANRPLP